MSPVPPAVLVAAFLLWLLSVAVVLAVLQGGSDRPRTADTRESDPEPPR